MGTRLLNTTVDVHQQALFCCTHARAIQLCVLLKVLTHCTECNVLPQAQCSIGHARALAIICKKVGNRVASEGKEFVRVNVQNQSWAEGSRSRRLPAYPGPYLGSSVPIGLRTRLT